MEFAVIALPLFEFAEAVLHQPVGRGELVMRGDHAAFPFDIGVGKRHAHRMRFQQQAKLGELLQIVDRDRRDLETAAAFRQHKTFGGEAIEDFAQCARR